MSPRHGDWDFGGGDRRDGHDHGRHRGHGDADGGRTLTLVSTDAQDNQATGGNFGGSFDPVASRNGRFVAFISSAENLVPGDTNGLPDVFLKDLRTGVVTLVSANEEGSPGNAISLAPSITANGRYIAFGSSASNLVAGDANGASDVFLRDLRTGEVSLVSIGDDGQQGNGESGGASISADGRFVAFQSVATNLDTRASDNLPDIFVKDTRTGEVTLVSVGLDGGQSDSFSVAPSISADGRFVAFQSFATNLAEGDTPFTVDVFVADLRTGEITLVSTPAGGTPAESASLAPAISRNGRIVAFQSIEALVPVDTNGQFDVYAKDMQTGELTLVSATLDGTVGDEFSGIPSISPNGRYVAFESRASNLAPRDTNGEFDVLVKDLRTGELTLVSRTPGGQAGNLNSAGPSVNNDGDVVFASRSSDLVPGDTNQLFDIFLWA